MVSRSWTGRRLLAILFMALLLSCVLATLLNVNAGRSAAEKRSLAELPHLTFDREGLTAFPRQFEQFINDRFGFRQQLVYLNSLIRVRLLGTSPLDKVVVGSDGWLFYADENTLSPDPLTPALLEKWLAALEAKRAWLAAQGIDYVFMVAPDKHTIYPEYLPRSRQTRQTTANLDLLIDYLKLKSTIRVLDVRSRLLSVKSSAPVYYKTDTHWNRFGAAIATEELLQRIAAHTPAVGLPAKVVSPRTFSIDGKDMAAVVLLQGIMKDTEVEPNVPVGAARFIVNEEAAPDGLLMSVSINQDLRLPKAVVFHDSYFNAMKPYFAEHFSKTVMVGGSDIHKFPPEIVEQEHPDVVVEEIVERYLTGVPPVPQKISQWYQERRGAPSLNAIK